PFLAMGVPRGMARLLLHGLLLESAIAVGASGNHTRRVPRWRRMGSDVMPRHFGILVPSTNATGEIEYCRLPAELQVHTGRLGKGGSTPFSPSLDADVAYQAKLLGEARVEVIALAQTSASLFTDDYDAVTVKRMTE